MTEIIVNFDWEGIGIEVKFDPTRYSCKKTDFEIAHLAIKAIAPANAPLPITETGFRSQFLQKEEIAERGGVEAYMRAWLDYGATSKEWQQHLMDSRQLSLF